MTQLPEALPSRELGGEIEDPPWAVFVDRTIDIVWERHRRQTGFYVGDGEDQAYMWLLKRDRHEGSKYPLTPLAINLNTEARDNLLQKSPTATQKLFSGRFENFIDRPPFLGYILAFHNLDSSDSEGLVAFMDASSHLLQPEGELFFRSRISASYGTHLLMEAASGSGLDVVEQQYSIHGGEPAIEVVWQKPF